VRQFNAAHGERKPTHAKLGKAHCDAALRLTVSVDHAGKLFERIETVATVECDKSPHSNRPRPSTAASEFLPAPRKSSTSGGFPHRRADFFCYFSLAAKEK
jgi:hypothetical protein